MVLTSVKGKKSRNLSGTAGSATKEYTDGRANYLSHFQTRLYIAADPRISTDISRRDRMQ